MKRIKEIIGKDWIPYTIAACSAVVVYLVLSHIGNLWAGVKAIFGYISPVFGGIIVAYVIGGACPSSWCWC